MVVAVLVSSDGNTGGSTTMLMTLAKFKKLELRDFENSAVRDEIYNTIKEYEKITATYVCLMCNSKQTKIAHCCWECQGSLKLCDT